MKVRIASQLPRSSVVLALEAELANVWQTCLCDEQQWERVVCSALRAEVLVDGRDLVEIFSKLSDCASNVLEGVDETLRPLLLIQQSVVVADRASEAFLKLVRARKAFANQIPTVTMQIGKALCGHEFRPITEQMIYEDLSMTSTRRELIATFTVFTALTKSPLGLTTVDPAAEYS